MIPSTQIAWLTGLLEGEGYFTTSHRAITIALNMTDADIVHRAATLLDGQVYGPLGRSHIAPHHRDIFRAQIKGPRAAGWMMTMYPMLGRRRREQVGLAIRRWRSMVYRRTSPLVERAIVDAWKSGRRNKSSLGRAFGVSRGTVYRIVEDERGSTFREGSFPTSPLDIAWLAGLLEGEGNISINGRSLTVRLKMTDQDVVTRAAAILGGRVYSDPKIRRWQKKPTWTTQVKGTLAAGWAMTLYPWFGQRRREQVRQAIAHWRTQGHGVISPGLGDSIRAYRQARYAQTEIMRLLGVSKSTVYRHTKNVVPRMRVCGNRPLNSPGEIREPQAVYGSPR